MDYFRRDYFRGTTLGGTTFVGTTLGRDYFSWDYFRLGLLWLGLVMGNGQKNLARADLGNARWKKSGTGRSGHCHFRKKVARAFCVGHGH